jgi:hypothetical protein
MKEVTMSKRVLSVLASMMLMVPLWVFAQGNVVIPDDPPSMGPYAPPDASRERGYIRVTNDWRDVVKITVWTRRGRQIGDYWTINPGQSVFLAGEGGQRITARPEYTIRVGDDWGSVEIGQIGYLRGDKWYINVRDVWRATHPGGRRNRGGWENRN